jgi:putative heme-binding domain-containing protein
MRRWIVFLLWCSGLMPVRSGETPENPVTILTPGFTVRELPVHLSNINNLRFRPDGVLTALGYDGRVWLLKDSDGDGLEDFASPYWDKQTLSVPVGMVWTRQGLVVSSHGKVSLLRDTNGDGKADVEEILADGWPPTDVASGGVDATAVTTDGDGNLYFGLLTADYSNPYRVKDGVSRYDRNGPRGTIQKWHAATHRLETIATGIRVPYTLAFNRNHDLFVTDQEGETWCPNGNPLDELNHIIPGRNYGFPPRHEKWLPDLVSEAPVVSFGPQHQSSCGLVFNESSARQRRFGPDWWEGDAFVAGESRGKIWRVKLVKTASGYVGRENIFARLNLLTTDVAISPGGDLYVSCHSGKPDWGTGPNGAGKIFKISYTDRRAPQPVAFWPSGSMELNVTFDRALDPGVANDSGAIKIEFGEFVRAADRLEVLKPPYKVVNQQEATPRGRLAVVGARLSADGRTLTLATDPQPQPVHYALTIPAVKARGATSSATVDLDYTLNGLEVKWFSGHDSNPTWHGWLPHLEARVNEAFLSRSPEHARLLSLLARPGKLEMHAGLLLTPGTNLIRVSAKVPFEVAVGEVTRSREKGRSHEVELQVRAADAPLSLRILCETGPTAPDFHVSTANELNPEERPVPFAALLLPWSPAPNKSAPIEEGKTELTGGDYERGRALFFGEQLKCATCHRLRNEGGNIGPDLSNLVHRDAGSVLRDINEPSSSINPDYVAYNVTLRDGDTLTGFVRAQDTAVLRVITSDGMEHRVPRNELKDLRPSPLSLMPAGLLEGLKEEQLRDLLTFLLHEPPTRTRADVEAILKRGGAAQTAAGNSRRPLHIVFVAGKQDHGPGQHDYPRWQKKWMELFGGASGVTVSDAWEWPTPDQFARADLIVCYFWNHDWSEARYQELDKFLERGGGLVLLHAATIADKNPEQLAERIGLAAQPGPTKYLHTPLTLKFVAPTNHPIARGFAGLELIDEPYWPMIGDTSRVEVLATTMQEGQERPMIWTFRRGPGRIFASIPSHYTWTLEDPAFRLLILRGMAWACGESVARFEGL